MLHQNQGDRFAADGKLFEVGGQVFANGNSVYLGLFGVVQEVHTSDNRETGDGTLDIWCAFEPPESMELSEQFILALCDGTDQVDEINLDRVSMMSKMLEPIPRVPPKSTGVIYVLSYNVDSDDGYFCGTLAASPSVGVLLRVMLDDLNAQGMEFTLSNVADIDKELSFTYKKKEAGMDNLSLNYSITPLDILPAAEGGATA